MRAVVVFRCLATCLAIFKVLEKDPDHKSLNASDKYL